MQGEVRCAIYTRKSVEEGLEQEFNSLDAQRLACEAYISARRMDGWVILPEHYDDGGYSGGTLNRPAFKRLMEDVRAGKIDMIICYKIDRLSRSLADYTLVFREFEEHHVSFACVTQEFNTSTSMGRMVVNLLMTFAQFEREMTSERVRDKMAATRKRGIWVGGKVPYGYRRVDKKFVVEPEAAAVIRKIFTWYLELGTPKLVVRKLNEAGHLFNAEKGQPWNTAKVATALRNCVYVGRIPLKGDSFIGVHEAIVDQDLWGRVQARLEAVKRSAPIVRNERVPALLTGLLRCGHCLDALSYTWTGKAKSGRKYAYYTCRKDMRRGQSLCPVKAVPAQIVEPLVEAEMIRFLKTPTMLRKMAEIRRCSPYECRRLLDDPESFWSSYTPVMKRDLFRSVIQRITVYQTSIDIIFKTQGSPCLAEEFKNEHHDA